MNLSKEEPEETRGGPLVLRHSFLLNLRSPLNKELSFLSAVFLLFTHLAKHIFVNVSTLISSFCLFIEAAERISYRRQFYRDWTGREDEDITVPSCIVYLILTKVWFILASLLWSICPNDSCQCSSLWSLHLLARDQYTTTTASFWKVCAHSFSVFAATAFSKFSLVIHRCLPSPGTGFIWLCTTLTLTDNHINRIG